MTDQLERARSTELGGDEPSSAEPSGAEPSGAEPSGAEPSSGESNGTETAGAEYRDRGAAHQVEVLITRLDPGLPLPAYAHPGDAGADLRTAVDAVIEPGERTVLPTGLALALPEGYAAFVHPRSGLAARYGVGLVNSPGTVDAGYRGEVKVIVVNLDRNAPVVFHRGDRIAQLVVQRVERARFREVARLPQTARGAGGFGSTGR